MSAIMQPSPAENSGPKQKKNSKNYVYNYYFSKGSDK